ncbi:hypothetical protein [Treponema sp. C6A8]|uniref:hypothetical protein n=1 Tax=Treponema sp. C6A8 TaxID=1410609 RepID=UPI00047F2342|nr:hypothetical protein [Treponema sp. C6A8]
MKIKTQISNFLFVFFALIALVPLSIVPLNVLFILDCLFAVAIFVIGISSAKKKIIPSFFETMVIAFFIFSVSMYINSLRNVLQMEPGVTENSFITLLCIPKKTTIIKTLVCNSIIVLCVFIFTLLQLYHKNMNKNETLIGVYIFIKGFVKFIFVGFLASVIGTCLIGMKKHNFSVLESLDFYFDYLCTLFIIFDLLGFLVYLPVFRLKLIDFDSEFEKEES